MAREPLPLLLAVAIERSYLDEVTATKVAAEVRRTGKAAERILLERGLLSERRVERLTLHVQYKTLRRADKAYAKLAMEGRAVDQATIDGALEILLVGHGALAPVVGRHLSPSVVGQVAPASRDKEFSGIISQCGRFRAS